MTIVDYNLSSNLIADDDLPPDYRVFDFNKVYWNQATTQKVQVPSLFNQVAEKTLIRIPCDECRVHSTDEFGVAVLQGMGGQFQGLAKLDKNEMIFTTSVEEKRIKRALATLQGRCEGLVGSGRESRRF